MPTASNIINTNNTFSSNAINYSSIVSGWGTQGYYNLTYSFNNVKTYNITSVKTFKLGDLTFNVYNCSNKLIRVNELLTTFKTTETGSDVVFNVGELLDFKSLEDAKNYIIRIRKQYKKMKAMDRQLDIDADFD